MGKKLISSAVLIMLITASFAQNINIGIKGGASLNKLDGKAFKDEFSYGYHVGGFATIGLSKKFAIQPEVLFGEVKADTASSFSTVSEFMQIKDVQLKYLTIPVLLNYNVSNLLALQVGPQFGILMNKDRNLFQDGQQAFKNGDFSMLGGVQLSLSKFRVYGRYAVGLSNIKNIDNQDEWKSQSIQLGVGLSL
ncbi:MAG: porin family protein [Ginsengibacter sp.]